MFEMIQTIPGRRDGYGDLALAIITQAAKDLNKPLMCCSAIEWLMSDEFLLYAGSLGMDANRVARKMFLRSIDTWRKWKHMTKTFNLVRDRDVTGISGTGVVAEGIVFQGGQTVICWTCPPFTVSVFPSPEAVLAVHGHQGNTRIVWNEETA